jgi:hypothetical protein
MIFLGEPLAWPTVTSGSPHLSMDPVEPIRVRPREDSLACPLAPSLDIPTAVGRLTDGLLCETEVHTRLAPKVPIESLLVHMASTRLTPDGRGVLGKESARR